MRKNTLDFLKEYFPLIISLFILSTISIIHIFTNDLWILNPATDPLVATFTTQFFINFIERIIIISSIIAFVILIMMLSQKLSTRKKAKIHHLEIDKPKEYQW